MKNLFVYFILTALLYSCKTKESEKANTAQPIQETPFVWEGANLYFLMTDRFNNGDPSNDLNFDRTKETGLLRGFEGGDIKGVTQKVKEGYFTDLGINAIWMTPIVEQIHGGTDEGTGLSYGFHGYWTKDWTNIDSNYGTKADLHELVDEAHKRGIRIVLDAVINHTGPVTEKDPVWPQSWVRTEPQCEYNNYENTITCTLVRNLPDIKTESNEEVALPPQLVEKWKAEGRYDQEVAELDAFFERTGHPRAPRFYIMKWLTDYITEFGIDGYRCDTVKHTEEFVWEEFKTECDAAFTRFKQSNPEKVLDNNEFYLVGEVYNYGISGGKYFNFGDRKVNYFDNMFSSQINFEFKWNAKQMLIADVFSKYDQLLQNDLKGYGILNYLSSHDDGSPFDKERDLPMESATILLLTPGTSQVYYGDEVARPLNIEGTQGDATLRSVMNWDDVISKKEILSHWQKLGQFRMKHPALGAGKHKMISDRPFTFSRTFKRADYEDKVVVVFVDSYDEMTIPVGAAFEDGTELYDAYSNQKVSVTNGTVKLKTSHDLILLELVN